MVRFFQLFLSVLFVASCSSQQQQQLDVVQNTQEQLTDQDEAALNAEQGKVAEGEAMNNAVEGEGNFAANPGAVNNGTANASLNNQVPLNNTSALTNAPPNNTATNLATNPFGNQPTNNAAAVQASVPTNAAVPSNNAAVVATPPASTAPGAAASQLNNEHMNWPGKGRVKYVLTTTTKHAQPNGPVVGTYEKGEHPLVYTEGNWVELFDGTYVQGSGLSDKGVGRQKRESGW